MLIRESQCRASDQPMNLLVGRFHSFSPCWEGNRGSKMLGRSPKQLVEGSHMLWAVFPARWRCGKQHHNVEDDPTPAPGTRIRSASSAVASTSCRATFLRGRSISSFLA